MGEQSMFTDRVNYTALAKALRKKGFTAVPETDVLVSEAKEAGGVALVEWVLDRIQANEGNFAGLLAYTLTEVGDE